ncbi:MAG: YggT family protein [Desulfovibrionales bacterium]|jgi:YggT family protein|nr:YggT family protein [Desulfovibrionales bacterium]
MGRLILAIAQILDWLLSAYMWIVIISALLSWVRPDPYNPIVRFLYAVTEPVLYRIRRLLPFVVAGGFDLSPIVVILVVMALKTVVVGNLYDLAARMLVGG